MVPPFLSNHVPPVDTDFLTFINEFLFNPPSARSTLRHQRTPSKHKRYRTMWRAAATALMKKRYSSQETHLPFEDHLLRELPSHDNGQSSKETHLSTADHLHRKLPSQASLNNGDSSQATPLPSEDEPLKNLPLGVSLDEGHSSQATYLSSADQFLRNLPSLRSGFVRGLRPARSFALVTPFPNGMKGRSACRAPLSQVFLDDGHSFQATDSPSADQLLRNLPSQGSLDYGGDLDTSDSHHQTHDRIDIHEVEEAPLITPSCSKLKKKGSASGCCSKAQPLEAISTPAVPKHSSRKPPRPPRASVSRSGSHRAIRFKIVARRAMVDNERMMKQKLSKSTSNATSMWALIITLCFASIMLVQGFLGSSSKAFGSKAEGQSVGEGVSSVSPYLGVPPFASDSSTRTLVVEHGAGTSLDRLQKGPRDLPFMNLRRHRLRRLGATSWHLL